MIYQKYSFIGFMLWIRYALLAFRPSLSLDKIYARHPETAGTKAYSVRAARALVREFRDVKITLQISHGDLLSPYAGQRHEGRLLSIARLWWPRRFVARYFRRFGLFMLITAVR